MTPVDAWTIYHTVGWAVAAFLAVRFGRLSPGLALVLAVLAGVGWELLEGAVVEPLLDFRECVTNRCIDVVVDFLGAFVGATIGAWAGRGGGRPCPL
jgi:hypothetical protein